MSGQKKDLTTKVLNLTVLVSGLGYFVDIYDLLIFGIVRIPSLKYLGLHGNQLIDSGVMLLNMQMGGMLIGGIIWGIIGDKKGRISVLFGSIFLYSIANFLNAFVSSIEMYGALRFLAGVGLAGELGAAITLVSEFMTKETRGYGTTIVATIGVMGAILGGIIGDIFTWQTAYIIGAVLGIILLITRISLFESGMYNTLKTSKVGKGKFLSLFTSKDRLSRYANSILIGLPNWFVVGILITFSPEFAKALGVTGPIKAGNAILFSYLGLTIGDFASGYLSQFLKSRKKAILTFVTLTAVLTIIYLFTRELNPFEFYTLCVLIGITNGYWAVFVMSASEQFGTNLRATVTTTVPNFIRGSVIPITLAFNFLRLPMGIIYSALTVGIVVFIIAFTSMYFLRETYGVDLDYIEEI